MAYQPIKGQKQTKLQAYLKFKTKSITSHATWPSSSCLTPPARYAECKHVLISMRTCFMHTRPRDETSWQPLTGDLTFGETLIHTSLSLSRGKSAASFANIVQSPKSIFDFN